MPPPSQGKDAGAGSKVVALDDGPEHALQKGMPAEAVKRIMGEPAETKPMASPTGKAEVWVYHRTRSAPNQQVQIGTRFTNITTIGGDGQAHVARTIEEPVFAQQIEIVEVTVRLLLFDGKYVEQTESAQKRFEYKCH